MTDHLHAASVYDDKPPLSAYADNGDLDAGGDQPTIVPAETPGVPLGDYFQSTTLDQGA